MRISDEETTSAGEGGVRWPPRPSSSPAGKSKTNSSAGENNTENPQRYATVYPATTGASRPDYTATKSEKVASQQQSNDSRAAAKRGRLPVRARAKGVSRVVPPGRTAGAAEIGTVP